MRSKSSKFFSTTMPSAGTASLEGDEGSDLRLVTKVAKLSGGEINLAAEKDHSQKTVGKRVANNAVQM